MQKVGQGLSLCQRTKAKTSLKIKNGFLLTAISGFFYPKYLKGDTLPGQKRMTAIDNYHLAAFTG